jgi:hypothetical protein
MTNGTGDRPPAARLAAAMAGKWTEAAILAIMAAIAASVMVAASGFPAGSWEYPGGIAFAIFVLAVWRAVDLLRMQPQETATESGNADEADDSPKEDLLLHQTLTYAAVVAALIVALAFVWFPVAAFIAGIAIVKWVFGGSWLNAVVTAALVSAVSSGVFYLLEVPLPGPGM